MIPARFLGEVMQAFICHLSVPYILKAGHNFAPTFCMHAPGPAAEFTLLENHVNTVRYDEQVK
jgi:hypothetical protein